MVPGRRTAGSSPRRRPPEHRLRRHVQKRGDLAGVEKPVGHDPPYPRTVVQHPLLGSGAGSFEVAWMRYRTIGASVRDAHNLYRETLAELGPLGLLLLVIALAIPLWAIPRTRRRAPTASICGAYVAFLGHAAVDWDWEMPVVTVTALLCASALLNAQRPIAEREPFRGTRVALIGVAAVSAGFVALTAVALLGSLSLHAAERDLQARSWIEGGRAARNAARWQPWSAEPTAFSGRPNLPAGSDEKPPSCSSTRFDSTTGAGRHGMSSVGLAPARNDRSRSSTSPGMELTCVHALLLVRCEIVIPTSCWGSRGI